MSSSPTALAIAASSRKANDLLADAGFKRKSVHLLRQNSDVLHCIHFQSSKWGTANDGRFTVNFVVTWSAIYEAWTGKTLPSNQATASYPIQVRIGACLPERTDVWWSVDPQTDLSVLSQEVGIRIAQVAPAFFAQFQSTAAVLARVRETRSLPGLTRAQAQLVHAFLAQSEGSSAEAKEILASALSEAGNSPFKATIRSFAQRAHVPLHGDA